MAGFTLYHVPLNVNIDAGKYLKNNTHSY